MTAAMPMADTILLTPGWANILGYSGDTLTVNVLVDPSSYVSGAAWLAQVRQSTGSEDVLEQFAVTLLPTGACLTLDAEQTAALNALGTVRRRQDCGLYQTFGGAWDVQVSWPDGRVQTLARGSIGIEQDVSRQDVLVRQAPQAPRGLVNPEATDVVYNLTVPVSTDGTVEVVVLPGGCGGAGGGGTSDVGVYDAMVDISSGTAIVTHDLGTSALQVSTYLDGEEIGVGVEAATAATVTLVANPHAALADAYVVVVGRAA